MDNDVLNIYAAGVFDCKGIATISIIDSSLLYPSINVTSRKKEVVLAVANRWGGVARQSTATQYTVNFAPNEALSLLKDIRPYIICNLEKIDIVISALEELAKLYRLNRQLSAPRKSVAGITFTLAPFYLQLNPESEDAKRIFRRVNSAADLSIELSEIKQQFTPRI
jgi:hypothetical protein